MEIGLEFLMLRYLQIKEDETLCSRNKTYENIKEAEEYVKKHSTDENRLQVWPCPFCDGANIVLHDGFTSSMKHHGYHVLKELPITYIEYVTGVSLEKSSKNPCTSISNKRLKESLEVYASENIFEHYSPENIADPRIREFFDSAEKAYFKLKEVLGCGA